LVALPQGFEAFLGPSNSARLVVLARAEAHSRILLIRLVNDEAGHPVVSPRIEFHVRFDSHAAHVVFFEDEVALSRAYVGDSEAPAPSPNRVVRRLVETFLAELQKPAATASDRRHSLLKEK
jgi:hypothetical protein